MKISGPKRSGVWTLLAAIFAAGGFASASNASADGETILFCQGYVTAGNDGVSFQTWEYYKIGSGQFSTWIPGNAKWNETDCDASGVECTRGSTFYALHVTTGSKVTRDTQINRQAGTVQEYTFSDDNSFVFHGNCRVAADPAQPSGPNKF
jgi:hypothetical protein